MEKKSEPDDLVYKTRVQTEQPAMVPAEVDGLLSAEAVGAIADCMADLTAGYEKQVGELRR